MSSMTAGVYVPLRIGGGSWGFESMNHRKKTVIFQAILGNGHRRRQKYLAAFDKHAKAWMNNAVFSNYLNAQRFDLVGGFFPYRNDLILAEISFLLKQFTKLRKGCLGDEGAFRPIILDARNANSPQRTTVRQAKSIFFANSERVHHHRAAFQIASSFLSKFHNLRPAMTFLNCAGPGTL